MDYVATGTLGNGAEASYYPAMAKTVHVIFKTHLDVGFTDLAAEVVRRYREHYIPQAMRVARELREAGGAERFVWTTGSWLIYEYLEQGDPAERRTMEQAIRDGDIRWHALPFTTHSELLDPGMFRFGLSLSQSLDQRFGMRTNAAKMTDVPGHSASMVPLLAEAGVTFLHIGVNPASRAPDVPDVFRWRCPGIAAEVVVMYHKANYGSAMTIDGLDHAIAFAHTGDNCGPQSAAHVREHFVTLREQFPGDTVVASSMEPFAAALAGSRDRLPLVEQEIGDTWIHGGGTDPWKVAAFRELSRLRARWLADGRAGQDGDTIRSFSRKLLVVPEHTWGMDMKTHLSDYRNYRRPDFAAARQRDLVTEPVPEALAACAKFRRPGAELRYSRMEASWREQRAYITDAVAGLAVAELRQEATAALAALRPVVPVFEDVTWRPAGAPWQLDDFSVRLDPGTGALVGFSPPGRQQALADGGAGLGLVCYQTFSSADYQRLLSRYNVNMQHTWCSDWAIPDFGKPGLLPEDSPSAMHLPELRRAGVAKSATGWRLVVELGFPTIAQQRYGAPERVFVEYAFAATEPVLYLTVQWFGKPANRMPEAMWCSFAPVVADATAWRLDKMGREQSPLAVVRNGNRNLHAVQRGVLYHGADGDLAIESLDAPLVAPGRPRLLEFDNSLPDLRGGFHFNLHNNIWGTNFPLWYDDDARFRFSVRY